MTERIALSGLVLRRSRPEDARIVADTVSRNLDHLRPWVSWATADAGMVEVQARRLATVSRDWAAGASYEFLAVDSAAGTMLGVFALHHRIGPDALELGYWLSHDATGRGHATEAARALTAAALALPDVERVEIHCDQANERSRRIPQRLGYRLERVERDQVEAPAESVRA